MQFTDIIIKPYQTEKTYSQTNIKDHSKYVFLVNPKANKFDIAIAFETIYNHRPEKVATQLRKPAHVRTGTAKPGYSSLIKIAYITLPKGVKINVEGNSNDVKAENKEILNGNDLNATVSKIDTTENTGSILSTDIPTSTNDSISSSDIIKKTIINNDEQKEETKKTKKSLSKKAIDKRMSKTKDKIIKKSKKVAAKKTKKISRKFKAKGGKRK